MAKNSRPDAGILLKVVNGLKLIIQTESFLAFYHIKAALKKSKLTMAISYLLSVMRMEIQRTAKPLQRPVKI